MRVSICPDSFKDCLSAVEVADALAQGFLLAQPDADCRPLPLADGGEGTVGALVEATGGRYRYTTVTGPLGEPVSARWGILGDETTAVIEMAAASGLELVPPGDRDPRATTTYGVGQLMKAALNQHVTRIVMGIGGSATNDAGAGMAQALGAHLRDDRTHELQPGGAALADLSTIDVHHFDPRLSDCEVIVACDVTNPLCGPNGASRVFGPQKGAGPGEVAELDAALANWAEVVARDLGVSVAATPGAGAAGGLGAGLMAFCDAKLCSGINWVLDAVEFDQQLQGCDLVITGEGQLDPTTFAGKTIAGVLKRAKAACVPVVAVGGAVTVSTQALIGTGIQAALALPDRPMRLEEALADAPRLLERAGWTIGSLWGAKSGRP